MRGWNSSILSVVITLLLVVVVVVSSLTTNYIVKQLESEEQKKIEQLKNLLVGYGFNEMINYSFVSEKEYDTFSLGKESDEYKFVKILNPLGEDLSVMRTSLIPSLVKVIVSLLFAAIIASSRES